MVQSVNPDAEWEAIEAKIVHEDEAKNAIDTANKFGVGVHGSGLVILMPPRLISTDEALVFAAWLVALADPLGEKFPAVLEAVQNT